MKLRHYIGIYVIANDINIENLSISIEKVIKKYFINPRIILETNELYWKEPESRCVVYSVLNNQMVKVSDLITFFPISWDYKEGCAYNLSIQQQVNTEEAIWSKLCHSDEQFLMPEIDWVHIYTSEDEEIPTIN